MTRSTSRASVAHRGPLSRRAFLGLCASAAAWAAPDARGDIREPRLGTDRDLRWTDRRLDGPDGARTRALIFAPVHERLAFSLEYRTRSYPALLLFDGAAAAEGVQAWRNQHRLADAYADLRRPPLVPGGVRARYMRPRQLARLNVELEKQPFMGLVLICPTPPAVDAGEAVIATYCDWLERELLPRVSHFGPIDDTPCLGIVGRASGARLALEVFARKPHLFRTFGAAQPNLGREGAPLVAGRLARAAAQSGFAGIHLQTSSEHRDRAVTRALHRELTQRGIATHLDDLLGPADDTSWRSAGLLSVLAWHERRLQLIERVDPSTAPPESDPPAKRDAQLPKRI
jgi:hypothetical protein